MPIVYPSSKVLSKSAIICFKAIKGQSGSLHCVLHNVPLKSYYKNMQIHFPYHSFYKIKGLSMSKNRYKIGKIIAFLQKMRLSHILKKLNIYKPCLLIVDINCTDLAVIGNRDFKVFGLSSRYSSPLCKLKAFWQYILNAISSRANTLPSIFTIGHFKVLE